MEFSLSDWAITVLMAIGVLFMVMSAWGMVRMPDLYLRNSVSSKGATLGVIALMLATAFYFDDLGVTSRALAVILFMMLTAPVAAHMIGRAGYKTGVPFWEETTIDKHVVLEKETT